MSTTRDVALLIGRTVLGGYLAAHGAQKLFGSFGGPGIEKAAVGFDQIGLRPGKVTARAAGLSELGGGILTITGLADPAGPVAIAGTMAVAATTHRANGPFAANKGYELPAVNLAGALALAAAGPGRYSLGRRTRLPRPLATLVIAGAAAGAVANIAMLLRATPAEPTPAQASASESLDAGEAETDASD